LVVCVAFCLGALTRYVLFCSQCQEFAEVFSLCVEVLEKADKASLIKVTLEAMLRFLNWIPLGYIFETPVIDHLIGRVSLSLAFSLPLDAC
jgi:hypothetical protein